MEETFLAKGQGHGLMGIGGDACEDCCPGFGLAITNYVDHKKGLEFQHIYTPGCIKNAQEHKPQIACLLILYKFNIDNNIENNNPNKAFVHTFFLQHLQEAKRC